MHVVITKKEACKHCMKITMSSKIIKENIKKKLIKIQKETSINGFRKGKVPLSIIKTNHINVVENNIIKELMQKKFLKTIQKNNINVIGKPIYTIKKYQPDLIFTYLIDFETYPEFNLKYPKIKNIKNLSIKITEEDIKKFIENIENKKKEIWNTVQRPIIKQDLITINYKISIDNKIIHKYTKTNFKFIIGNNYLLPIIEKKILKNENKNKIIIETTFPNYHCDNFIQGKTAKISLDIQKVEEKQKYSLKSISNKKTNKNYNDQDYIKFYNTIKKQMNIDAQTISRNYLKKQIQYHLLKENSITIPSVILDHEVMKLKNEIHAIYKEKGEPILLSTLSYEDLINNAKNKVKLKLLFKKIAETNNCTVDETIMKILKNNLLAIMKNNKKLNQLYLNNNFMKITQNLALEETIYNFLLKKLNFVEKKCNFQEALKNTLNVYL
ncbi:Trigger factor [Buchnera aphidicola (Eriosoma grossulariae)]|uniref:trigger factor n=1 Tax=Buchnera aphidicola TaxID=9 RepID=UPI003464DCFC